MELARLETIPQSFDLREALENAHRVVRRLALQRAVTVKSEIGLEPLLVSADGAVVQQVLTTCLSYTIQQAQPGSSLVLQATKKDETASITLTFGFTSLSATAELPSANPVITQLLERLGWRLHQEIRPSGICTIALEIDGYRPKVLVIDDNQGLVQLLERYLTNQGCHVVPATGGQEGLRLAQELLPAAIVLDVMMPGMDGWEILQRLRVQPKTAKIPVIICSVINDPGLAYSLGATHFLAKPIRQQDILAALREVGVV